MIVDFRLRPRLRHAGDGKPNLQENPLPDQLSFAFLSAQILLSSFFVGAKTIPPTAEDGATRIPCDTERGWWVEMGIGNYFRKCQLF